MTPVHEWDNQRVINFVYVNLSQAKAMRRKGLHKEASELVKVVMDILKQHSTEEAKDAGDE